MASNKFNITAARRLAALLRDGRIAHSSMPQWLADELRAEGLVAVVAHGSRRVCMVVDSTRLDGYVRQNFTVGSDLQRWIEVMERGEDVSRAQLVTDTGNSKSRMARSFRGFLVKCCEPIEASLCGSHITLQPADGMAMFIQSPETFTIADGTVVVGVENGENFRLIGRQRHLFGQWPRVLFVSRYPQSADLRRWLMAGQCQYVHYGDFDLAGIAIYLNEFYKHLGQRASFFIPGDIEQRLRHGNSHLYDTQYAACARMPIADPRLEPLVALIHKYRRGYEQEGYIPPEK